MLKKIIKVLAPDILFQIYNLRPLLKRKCPICEYFGYFKSFGRPPRLDAMCKKCKSLERHRLFFLNFKTILEINKIDFNEKILHFSPEKPLEDFFRKNFKNYFTSEINPQIKTDYKFNIENIDIDENTFKIIIANHVLEHVDDFKASSEIKKILKKSGLFICSVPIIEGWEKTYEDKSILLPKDKELHYSQHDHLRYYGADFVTRIVESGLELLKIFTANGDDSVKYGLNRGEKIFVFIKTK